MRPDLYRYPGHNEYFSVHTYAEKHGISVRKARRQIAKMYENGELEVLFRAVKIAPADGIIKEAV